MELSIKETVCVGLHLRAHHRQTVYNETADLGEPCAACPYVKNCRDESGYLWAAVFRRICNAGKINISFREGQYPLVPRHKQDIHNG